MPTTVTPISPDEPSSTIQGGFPLVKQTLSKPSTTNVIGGAGSLNLPIQVLPNPTGETSANTNAGVVGQDDNAPVPGGLSDDVAKFTSDVDEVTLTNTAYYSSTQPFLANITLQFPTEVDEGTTVSTDSDFAGPSQPGVTPSTSTTSVTPSFSSALNTDNTLDVRPNNFLGLTYQRIFNGVGNFTLVLFDPKWDAIETKLNKNKGYFRFKYGYSDGGPNAMSPWYLAKSLNYKLDFGLEGTTITITGLTTGYSLGFTKTYDAHGVDNTIISDIAKSICDAFGSDYVAVIEKTKSVPARDGMVTTDTIEKITTLNGETHLRMIIDQLCKYAVNEAGQGDYGFFIRVSPTGKNEFHFHTMNYDPPDNSSSSSSSSTTSAPTTGQPQGSISASESVTAKAPGKTIPGFTQFKNKNSALIRFTPSWSMTLAQLTGGGGTTSAIIDTNSKDIAVVNFNMNNNPQKMDSTNPSIVACDAVKYVPNTLQTDTQMRAFRIITTPVRSKEQNKAVAQAAFSKSFPGAITGTLEIFGTPNFYLTQKIAVFVFKPQGDNQTPSTSNVHWISGFFRIIQITDSISAGSFRTTFELLSDGRTLVAPDPVKSSK